MYIVGNDYTLINSINYRVILKMIQLALKYYM